MRPAVRHTGIVIALVAACVVAGVAFAATRHPVSSPRRAAAGQSSFCPSALAPARLSMRRVAPVLQREVPRAFADPDPSFVQGYTPVGLVSLNPATAFLRMASRYHQAAALKCGRRVANRSWVAFIDFRAPRTGRCLPCAHTHRVADLGNDSGQRAAPRRPHLNRRAHAAFGADSTDSARDSSRGVTLWRVRPTTFTGRRGACPL